MTDWSFNNLSDFNNYLRGQLPWYDFYTEYVFKPILKEYAVTNSTVYDIGASQGNGYLAYNSLNLGRQINFIAIESNESFAKNYVGDKTSLYIGDALCYPYKDFSLAICNLVLSFLPKHEQLTLVQRLVNVARPGSAILVLDKFCANTVETSVLFHKITTNLKIAAEQPDIIGKYLSLSGVQKPLNSEILSSFEKIFQVGEFSAYLYVKS